MSIRKPSANPIVALLLCMFVFNLGHLLINGQMKKWIFTIVAILVGYILCFLPGMVIAVLNLIEVYKTAQRLQAGEEIGENEYSFKPLFSIIKIIDKSATFAG